MHQRMALFAPDMQMILADVRITILIGTAALTRQIGALEVVFPFQIGHRSVNRASGRRCVALLAAHLMRDLVNRKGFVRIIAITARLSIIKFVKKKNSDKNGCCGAKCPRLHDHLIPSRLYDLLMQDSVFVWRNPLQPLESTGKGCSIVHADFFHNVLHAHIGKQHLLGIFYPDIHQIF